MISGNVQNLLLEENPEEEGKTGSALAVTIEKGMRTVLSTVSRASPGFKDATKLLQPPSNRATLGTSRHRSISHPDAPSSPRQETSESDKKKPNTDELSPEDKTVSSSRIVQQADDHFEQVV